MFRCIKKDSWPTLRKFAYCPVTRPSRFRLCLPYETMILIIAKDYNQFTQDYYDSVINNLQFHQLTCSCGHSSCLSIHAYYIRGVFCPDGVRFLRICRVKCSECGATHALLPSSLVPYDRISLLDQRQIICDYENGSNRNAICEENPSIDENCVKAVIRRYLLFWFQRLLAEAISLSDTASLVRSCVSVYSLQFMQIHRTSIRLFPCTT